MKLNRMNKIVTCFLILVLSVLCLGEAGCKEEDAQDKADREAVNLQQEQYRKAQPVMYYEYSNELDVYQQIYDARVEGSIRTWTVERSNSGEVLDDFVSLGFPIPYDAQLTNPLKVVDLYDAAVAIEQPEPNGLYSSKNTAATWVLVVRRVGDISVVTPFYSENKISCYPYPIDVNYATNRVTPVPDVMPSMMIESNRPKLGG